MSKSKNTKRVVIVMMTFMMLFSAMSIFASATHQDRDFSFYFGNYRAATTREEKDNTSSLYMYCQQGTPYIASAGASYSDSQYSTVYDVSHGYSYSFAPNTRRFMYNFVLEEGFSYAVIIGTTSTTGSATGKWSPDSIPQAGVLPGSDYIK